MSIIPDEIDLSTEQKRQLARIAELAGKSWQQILDEALAEFEHRRFNGATTETAKDRMVRLGLLGCLSDAPPDLSTNPKYMEGFGGSAK